MKKLGFLACTIALYSGLAAAQDKGGTLEIAIEGSPVGLDPHVATAFTSTQVFGQIYEGLVEIDKNLKVKPALASSWTVGGGGLRYVFKIRPNVVFHDGTPMTASDVVYSFNRVRDPKIGSAYASRIDLIKNIRATGPLEVTIDLSKTYTPFLSQISAISIVSEKYVKAGGDLKSKAMGTGPFILKTWIPDTSLLLTKNTKYWMKDLPYLDALKFNIVTDQSTRQVGLQSGTYQFIPAMDATAAMTLKNANNVKISEVPDLSYMLVGMNVSKPPFNNAKVRQALNYAINRPELVEAVFFGRGTPAGPLSPVLDDFTLPTTSYPCYKYDPNQAKKLLAEAGFPNGVDLTISTFGTIKAVLDTAQVVQAQLNKAGFRTKLNIMEYGNFVSAWRNSDFQAFVSINGGNIDPDGYLYRTFLSTGTTNVFKYNSPRVDKLLVQARSIPNGNGRIQQYAALQKELACSGPISHLAYGNLFTGMRSNVKGFEPVSTRSLLYLRQTYLDK